MRKLIIPFLFILASAIVPSLLFFSAGALAASSGKDVNVTNKSINVNVRPFCPCFSVREIDDHLLSRVSGSAYCADDRNVIDGSAATQTVVDGLLTFVEVSTVDGGANWSCKLVVDGSPVIAYENIGLNNAVACRIKIIRSQTWVAAETAAGRCAGP